MTADDRADLERLALAVLHAAKSTTAQAAIVEATAARVVDALASRPAEVDTASLVKCPHPDDAREDAGTLRRPRQFYCHQCREFVNPSPGPVAA